MRVVLFQRVAKQYFEIGLSIIGLRVVLFQRVAKLSHTLLNLFPRLRVVLFEKYLHFLKKYLTISKKCIIIKIEDLLPSEITLRVQIKFLSIRRLYRSAQVLRSYEIIKESIC